MRLVEMCGVCLAALLPVYGATGDVLTSAYNVERTGANQDETILNIRNVNAPSFGRLFALPVDGFVFAQPLYMAAINVPGQGTHNVVYVATMHNTVYAFDADDWDGAPLWTTNLGTAVPPGTYGTNDVSESGILSTPVIDPASQTLYAVSNNDDAGVVSYQLHALDLASGMEKQSPELIGGSVAGSGAGSVGTSLAFDPMQHLQRPGLLLSNGAVYIAFGSHADIPPYHGWVLSYSANDIHQQLGIYCSSPNGNEAAFWQSGRGPAADSAGNVYAATGNGDFDGVSSFGESVLKLSPSLALLDWFAPDSWLQLNARDYDLGSSGVLLMPGQDQLVSAGKSGSTFVLSTSNLGHTLAGNTQVEQALATASGIFGASLWNGPGGPTLYVQNSYYAVTGYRTNNGGFETNPSLVSAISTGTAYDGIAVSSNGTSLGTGIVWVTSAPDYGSTQPGTLTALNAVDLGQVLWSSANDPGDALGAFAKFAVPTVANGKVYVPTFSNQVMVYGLRAGSASVPQIQAVTNAASYSSGAVTPGEIVTLFGTGFGTDDLFVQTFADDALGNVARGFQVTFDGLPAPVLYTAGTSASVIVPFGILAPLFRCERARTGRYRLRWC